MKPTRIAQINLEFKFLFSLFPYQKASERAEPEPVGACESSLLVQIANGVDLLFDHQMNRPTESDVLELTFGSVDLVGE